MSSPILRTLSLSLAALALAVSPLLAQGEVKLEVSPAEQTGHNTFIISSGQAVTLTISSALKSAEVHLYGFHPVSDLSKLDVASMVILHQEILREPGMISLAYDIEDNLDGLGVSLLAVGWDAEGNGHASEMLTLFVNHEPVTDLSIKTATEPDTNRESPGKDWYDKKEKDDTGLEIDPLGRYAKAPEPARAEDLTSSETDLRNAYAPRRPRRAQTDDLSGSSDPERNAFAPGKKVEKAEDDDKSKA